VDTKTLARLKARSQVFKALGHPTRLMIVEELARAEKCVCELTGLVGSDMSTVSKHLSVLKTAGVVLDERRGSQVWYRLQMLCVSGFISCIQAELYRRACERLELAQPGSVSMR
jgi:DNA-binding transcriptional ArsR family regulator